MAPLIPIAMQLAQFVPGIISLLSGSDKAGEVAAKVVDIAKVVTGTETAEEAVAAIAADPAKMLDFQREMAAQKLDMEKAYLADTANARDMQKAALTQDDLFSKRFVYIFASAWSLFTMVYFVAVTFITLSPLGQRVADTIMGVLIACVLGSIFNYFYGSTASSRAKDSTISNLTK